MRRSRRVVFGAALVAVLVFAGIATAETEINNEKPLFRVENAAIDLGTIIAGTDAVATYVFHNDSDVDVKILKAKPS